LVKRSDPGIIDKRLLVLESEFASVLKVLNREGNTLSPVIRNAWDTGDLNILVKNSPTKATDAHISIISHVTKNELLVYLDDVEAGNGFGNRFLWAFAQRSKCLPEGGQLDDGDMDSVVAKVKAAVDFAGNVGRVSFDTQARKLWREVYPELSDGKPGLVGRLIARAEAQVVRLALIYALLDLSNAIGEVHLQAALAVWKYCERSCRFIFGERLGFPLADRILDALRRSPDGMTRTDISDLFKRHQTATSIDSALELLEQHSFAERTREESGGRPIERWFAIIAHAAKEANYAKN